MPHTMKGKPQYQENRFSKKEPTSPNRDTIPDSKYRLRPYRNIA